jgi:hypothetical protein
MTPHRWSWSFVRIVVLTFLAIGFCGWRSRDELLPWPAKSASAASSAAQRTWGWAIVGKETLPIRVYGIHDLISSDLDPSATQTIIRTLRQRVAANSWQDGRFDEGPSIRQLPGELVVVQTRENHVLVAHELAWMKWRRRALEWAKRSAWIVVPVFALAVCGEVSIARRRRRAAIRNHRCLGCGYDLRASPERCPECGTARVIVTQSCAAPN